ncbi:hypothetical protein ALC53_06052 [Atta colombica]|uniref:Uncharacterized protein n=1 Tax=Atta colombica TaxID=520822 RepID=A0A151I354_9HYME|nr:hypothetical protein ALC53_06052 [Atta colombica]
MVHRYVTTSVAKKKSFGCSMKILRLVCVVQLVHSVYRDVWCIAFYGEIIYGRNRRLIFVLFDGKNVRELHHADKTAFGDYGTSSRSTGKSFSRNSPYACALRRGGKKWEPI